MISIIIIIIGGSAGGCRHQLAALGRHLAEDSVGEAQEVPRREEAASGCPGDGLMLSSCGETWGNPGHQNHQT